MKVKEAIELLKKCDPNCEMIVATDAEGNNYVPLADISNKAVYNPENSYSGTVYWTDWTAEDACMDKTEWNRILRRKRCVVLSPV